MLPTIQPRWTKGRVTGCTHCSQCGKGIPVSAGRAKLKQATLPCCLIVERGEGRNCSSSQKKPVTSALAGISHPVHSVKQCSPSEFKWSKLDFPSNETKRKRKKKKNKGRRGHSAFSWSGSGPDSQSCLRHPSLQTHHQSFLWSGSPCSSTSPPRDQHSSASGWLGKRLPYLLPLARSALRSVKQNGKTKAPNVDYLMAPLKSTFYAPFRAPTYSTIGEAFKTKRGLFDLMV